MKSLRPPKQRKRFFGLYGKNCYFLHDVKIVMNARKSNFGTKMNLQKREKNTHEIRLGTASLQSSHSVRFGFCGASSLIWGSGVGCGCCSVWFCPRLQSSKRLNSVQDCKFWEQTNYQHWSTRTNSAVWQVPYACAQPNHPGSGSHGQLFLPYWGSSVCRV